MASITAFGSVLRLERGFENVDVIIGSLQALAPDGIDALHYLAGIDQRLRGGEGLEVLAGGFRST
jgi:hypothetical protein